MKKGLFMVYVPTDMELREVSNNVLFYRWYRWFFENKCN